MNILFFNLASHNPLFAAVTEDGVCASYTTDERIGDEKLIPIVDSVLKEAKWTYEDVTHIACIIGPGGFTSLRIAVTFANVLADQLQIPSAGIHLSQLYAARIPPSSNDVYWLHSTKKTQVFIRGGKWNEPTLISLEELPPLTAWMGELIDEHRAIVGSDSIDLLSIEDILPAFLASQQYSSEILLPWYGRGW